MPAPSATVHLQPARTALVKAVAASAATDSGREWAAVAPNSGRAWAAVAPNSVRAWSVVAPLASELPWRPAALEPLKGSGVEATAGHQKAPMEEPWSSRPRPSNVVGSGVQT